MTPNPWVHHGNLYLVNMTGKSSNSGIYFMVYLWAPNVIENSSHYGIVV